MYDRVGKLLNFLIVWFIVSSIATVLISIGGIVWLIIWLCS